MSEDITVDVEVEVDSDELEIERDDAELVEASYEAGGIEIGVEAQVETHGGGGADGEAHAVDDGSSERDDE
jgi:hypothetical protein